VLEECTTEEQRSVVGKKDSMQSMFINKCFLFMVGSVCHVNRYTNGLRNSLKEEEIETEVHKWPRQQSKYLCTVGFDALVKRWDKCTIVGRGYVEKYMFFPGLNILCFKFYIHL
jgi:hypothetical protein